MKKKANAPRIERPILFSAPMVRAILGGWKTQTRRLFNPKRCTRPSCDNAWQIPGIEGTFGCPYGTEDSDPPDLLWVRETWAPIERRSDAIDGIRFRADDAFVPIENTREAADRWVDAANNDHSGRWRPSIHMPRWASRITLELVETRIERLQDISTADAMAEGIPQMHGEAVSLGLIEPFANSSGPDSRDLWDNRTSVENYAALWNTINGKRAPWSSNPWVWALTFSHVKG